MSESFAATYQPSDRVKLLAQMATILYSARAAKSPVRPTAQEKAAWIKAAYRDATLLLMETVDSEGEGPSDA